MIYPVLTAATTHSQGSRILYLVVALAVDLPAVSKVTVRRRAVE